MNYLLLNGRNRINIFTRTKGYLCRVRGESGWEVDVSRFYKGEVFPFQFRLAFSDFIISFPTVDNFLNFYSFVFKDVAFCFLGFDFPFAFEKLLLLEDKVVSFVFEVDLEVKRLKASVWFSGFESLPDDLYVSYVFKVGENLLCDFGLKNYFSLGKIKSLLRIFDNMSFSVSNSCGKVYFSPFGDSINVLDIKILDYLNNISTKEEFKVLSLFFTNGKG